MDLAPVLVSVDGNPSGRDDSMDSDTKDEGLGSDGTIPQTDDGIAVGFDPEGTTFEPEEEAGEGDPARARKKDEKPTGVQPTSEPQTPSS